MDERNKKARHTLRTISPVKARALLMDIGLPADEEQLVLMHDIEGKDLRFVADTLGMCERKAKTLHRSALCKIVDTIE